MFEVLHEFVKKNVTPKVSAILASTTAIEKVNILKQVALIVSSYVIRYCISHWVL